MIRKRTRYTRQKGFVINASNQKQSLLEKVISSDTLLIASVPIFIYFLFYVKYSSYLNALQIPVSFITFDISIIINDLVYSLLFFLIVFCIVGGTLVVLKFFNDVNFSTVYVISVFVIFILGLMTSPVNQKTVILMLASLTLINITAILVNIISLSKNGYKGNLVKKAIQRNIEIETQWLSSFLTPIYLLGGKKLAVLIMVYIGMIASAFSIGKMESVLNSFYFIANTNPECVVVYQTSEKAVCSPFNRAKREIEPSYKVIFFQDNQNLEFKRESIGPIHLKPTPTPTLKPTFTPTVTITHTITYTPSPTFTLTSIPTIAANP